MTTVRRLYEPPMARDLSRLRAHGGTLTPLGDDGGGIEPMGMCTSGSTVSSSYTCTDGGTPVSDGATCSPVGFVPTMGGCFTGTTAIQGCNAGSMVT